MTIPVERTRAVEITREFLYALLDPKQTPKVPRKVRERARSCIRHYPGPFDMFSTAMKMPTLWGPPE